MKKSYRLDGSPQTQKAMMAELAAKEVAGNVVAIYLGDSGQARNAAKAPANHVEAFPEKQHELGLSVILCVRSVDVAPQSSRAKRSPKMIEK
jgi:hypothetical protein